MKNCEKIFDINYFFNYTSGFFKLKLSREYSRRFPRRNTFVKLLTKLTGMSKLNGTLKNEAIKIRLRFNNGSLKLIFKQALI